MKNLAKNVTGRDSKQMYFYANVLIHRKGGKGHRINHFQAVSKQILTIEKSGPKLLISTLTN